MLASRLLGLVPAQVQEQVVLDTYMMSCVHRGCLFGQDSMHCQPGSAAASMLKR